MASLTILSIEELNIVINKAKELIVHTPFSFRILANKLGFLIPKNKNIKINYEKYKPYYLQAMPIFPVEVLHYTNHSKVKCPDENCKTMIKFLKDKNYSIDNIENKDFKCEKCDLKYEKKIKYIFIDLRILEYGLNEEDKDNTGFLPLMMVEDQNDLKSEDIGDIIEKRLINEKGKFHIVFITSDTDEFPNFEENLYKENIPEEEKRKMMFGLIEKEKKEKELIFDPEKLTTKQLYRLKEYNNLKIILKTLQKQNYPYLGFVYNGFEGIHKTCIDYGIDLIFHNKETCILCNPSKNNKETSKNKFIIKKKLFSKNEYKPYQFNLNKFVLI